MNVKELVKRAVRAVPCKYQMYKIVRLAVRHSKPLHIDNAREQLMRIHPKPAYHYAYPEFAYTQPDRDLSIIVPAYNVERFVGPCLESILNQETKVDFEVIVINDGSTDGTGDVISKYARKDNRIRVINQRNKGLSGARNTGIDQAKGKALMFVDSDDLIAPTHVDALMKALKAGDCDYVTSSYTDIDEAGNQIGQGKPREFMGTAWGRAYWRYVWDDVRFPEGYLYEDTILSFLIETRYENREIEDKGYLYRHTRSSISRKKGSDVRCLDTYWILEYLLNERKTLGLPLDDSIKKKVVDQCGDIMYHRCKKLRKEQKQLIFSAAASLVQEIDFRKSILEKSDIGKAISKNNYRLWNLACIFKIIENI